VKDDAISPVVALMLILTIAVTLFSLWNSLYLPGLKQQAEVEHLQQVEEAFFHIDADISNMIARQWGGTMIENVPLGGGETLVHSMRSGGWLKIADDTNEGYILNISNDSFSQEIYLYPIRYMPVSNFWLDQGYIWEKGCVNVTKGDRTTWRFDIDETEVKNKRYKPFASSLFTCDERTGEIVVANFLAGSPREISGNAMVQVKMEGTISRVNLFRPRIIVNNVRTPFGDAVNSSVNASLDRFHPEKYPVGEDRFIYSVTDGQITFRFYNLTFSVT
jgi:hypothetical protein